jgi:lipopolysaccharide export system permease protein
LAVAQCSNPTIITAGDIGPKARMKLIERYILQKILGATTLTFVALGTMVWLSQALRQFDLVTANGQTVWTFLFVSALLVPALVTIVLPVALLISVIYSFTHLNGDSELIVINSSGAGQLTVLRPVLVIGVIVTLMVASMSLYFAPLSLRAWQMLITNVRGDVLTSVLQPGQFMRPVPGLTIHISSRDRTARCTASSFPTHANRADLRYLAETRRRLATRSACSSS